MCNFNKIKKIVILFLAKEKIITLSCKKEKENLNKKNYNTFFFLEKK